MRSGLSEPLVVAYPRVTSAAPERPGEGAASLLCGALLPSRAASRSLNPSTDRITARRRRGAEALSPRRRLTTALVPDHRGGCGCPHSLARLVEGRIPADVVSPDAGGQGVPGLGVSDASVSRRDRRHGGRVVGSDRRLRRRARQHVGVVRTAAGEPWDEDGVERAAVGDRQVDAVPMDGRLREGPVRIRVRGPRVSPSARQLLTRRGGQR